MKNKPYLRQFFLSKRLNISETDYKIKNSKLLKKIKQNLFPSSDIFCLYSPIKKEPDITSLLTDYPSNKMYFPKVTGKSEMKFYYTENLSDLFPGAFSVSEPLPSADRELSTSWNGTPVVFLVPGICFDRTGHRIGYGKGYYDIFFHNLTIPKEKYTLIGIAFSEQISDKALPHSAEDVAMDYIITDKEIIPGGSYEDL